MKWLVKTFYRTKDFFVVLYWKFKTHRQVASLSFEEGENVGAMRRWDEAHGIDAQYYICITKAKGKKCARCWIYKEDVDTHMWSDVCQRCNDACQWMWENYLDEEAKLDWMDKK